MADRRFPDFYIIGAPKCGTTAVYKYLSEHPSVFLPSLKEPHYFASDLTGYPRIRDLEAYLALFSDAPATAITGEASVWYLFSEVAVRAIMKARPDARIIVMLRNPIEMAPSLHQQQVISLTEDILDFAEAWRAQDDREHGRRVPVHCTEPRLIQYGRICRFSAQIERVKQVVPERQLLVLLYEEFFSDPEAQYRRVQDFLGLPLAQKTEFERVNVGLAPAHPRIHQLVTRPPAVLRPVYVMLRKLSQTFGFGLGRLAVRLMKVRQNDRVALTPEMKSELCRFFAEDVRNLETLLGRSLQVWRADGHRASVPAPADRRDSGHRDLSTPCQL
jgi:hypothetical protein